MGDQLQLQLLDLTGNSQLSQPSLHRSLAGLHALRELVSSADRGGFVRRLCRESEFRTGSAPPVCCKLGSRTAVLLDRVTSSRCMDLAAMGDLAGVAVRVWL